MPNSKIEFNWKIFGLSMLATVLIAAALGIFESSNSSDSQTQGSEEKIVQPTAEPSSEFDCPSSYLDMNEGDVCANQRNEVVVDDWRVEAKGVSRSREFLGPEVCFEVFLRNLDSEARSFAESDFRLRWPSGQVHDFWTDFSSGGTLGSAPLAAGGYADGKVCFEDPREVGEYMLIFKPGIYSERGIWFYNLK